MKIMNIVLPPFKFIEWGCDMIVGYRGLRAPTTKEYAQVPNPLELEWPRISCVRNATYGISFNEVKLSTDKDVWIFISRAKRGHAIEDI